MSFRDEVDGLNARFLTASKRNDAAGACAEAYQDDAIFIAGPELTRGRAAITAAVAGAWNAGDVLRSITTLAAEADGNIGYAIESVDTDAGQGIALLVLKRSDSGSWKITAEAYFEK